MLHRIEVRPFGERNWQVDYGEAGHPMLFRSGARAEAAARTLAVRLADEGHSAVVTITIRGGWIAANFMASPSSASIRTE